MMNGIDNIIQRLNHRTRKRRRTPCWKKPGRRRRRSPPAIRPRRTRKRPIWLPGTSVWRRSGRNVSISAAQMEARKTVLAAKQAVMEETYAKALEKLRNLSETRYVEVLTELLLQAAPHGVGEVLFSAQDRETVGQAAVDAANGKSGGKLTLSGETAPIQGGFILKDGNVEVNCAFDTLVRLQKAETAGQVAQRLFG